jgi:DNA polymerase III subunit delta'
MHLKPSENFQLLGMDRYFREITDLYIRKKMPNKILLSGKKGLGKSTLAYHIINYVLSLNEDYKYDILNFKINLKNKSFKLIQNQSHPNFYLVDLMNEKKFIDVLQIREMINYTNKSCFDNMPRFILIDNIENLNKNSVNALLKVVEEPNDGIFFILISNSEKKISSTLKSRCLTFKINLSFGESIEIANRLFNKNILNFINKDLINYYLTPGKIVNLVELAEDKKINLLDYNLISFIDLLIDKKYYKKDKLIKNMMLEFIELFFLKLYRLSNKKKLIFGFYHDFLINIKNSEKFNLDEETLFIEFKSKLLNG